MCRFRPVHLEAGVETRLEFKVHMTGEGKAVRYARVWREGVRMGTPRRHARKDRLLGHGGGGEGESRPQMAQMKYGGGLNMLMGKVG